MAGHPARRYPLEPLLALLHLTVGRSDGWASTIADLAGVDRRSVQAWVHDGGIPERRADRIALSLGLHGALIWDGWTPEEAAA